MLACGPMPTDCPPPATLAIHDWPLPYAERLATRLRETIDLIVVHCTELPDLATAREYGERILYDSGTGNCGHLYIDRDGSVHRFAPIERIKGDHHNVVGLSLPLLRGLLADLGLAWHDLTTPR